MTRFNLKGKASQGGGANRNSTSPSGIKNAVVISGSHGGRKISQSGKNQGNSPSFHGLMKGQQNHITQLREKSQKSDKWNLFVGDSRYKTNFMLHFKDRFTRMIYEKQLLPNSFYSIRLLIILMAFFDICVLGYKQCSEEDGRGCFLTRLVVVIFAVVSLIGTHKSTKKFTYKAR